MEYYILKKYEEEKSKDDEIEKGFKRFSNNVKRLIYLLFVIMAVACTEIIITLFIFPNPIWQFTMCSGFRAKIGSKSAFF